MIYAAQIINNVVTRIVCCESADWCTENLTGSWTEVSRNPMSSDFAGVGDTYDPQSGTFTRPQPIGNP